MKNSGLTRQQYAKLNILFSLISQVITIACGFVVPKLMIGAYGSEVYGATASIAQFLAYISLLEGGIGGVARASLYKPLAENDNKKISAIISELEKFFRAIAYIFVAYTIILAVSYKYVSNLSVLDWSTTAILVVSISLSTLAQYYFGISKSTLLQADQRVYITTIINIVTIIMNTIFTIILVEFGCNIVVVKLVSSFVFILRPVALSIFVKRNYNLEKIKEKSTGKALEQKWTGLGQHLAYFLHTNTDVVVLTIFSNLKYVAVYSVYNMIIANIRGLIVSFCSGMEAVFGNMLAKKENEVLNRTFNNYDTLISLVASILMATTASVIIPFIKVYTEGVEDVNYVMPVFAMAFVAAELIYCLRQPYHNMVIAAGKFKETKWAAYGEAFINIVLSIILVIKWNIIGVAIGTLVAIVFRYVFYAIYVSKEILHRSVFVFIKRQFVSLSGVVISITVSIFALGDFDMSNYTLWIIGAIIAFSISTIINFAMNFIFYKTEIKTTIFQRKKVGK